MAKIQVKNFGPIKTGCLENDGWLEIKKVTVFIGNQGSGKSTVAKLIATLLWMEKALNRRDFGTEMSIEVFKSHFKYQGIFDYFKDNTEIDFVGEKYAINYNVSQNKSPIIHEIENTNYQVPKLMYVPDTRSFLSSISNATGVKRLPEPLFEFAIELKSAQSDTGGKAIPLPINGVKYRYEEATDASYILGEDYIINLLNASSGFHSLVPLYLVSNNLARIVKNGSAINPTTISVDHFIRMKNDIMTTLQGKSQDGGNKYEQAAIIRDRYQNKAFINIVEEPEQNLFPSSQRQILNSLLELNNMDKGNKLIMTTHSQYMVIYLSIAIQSAYLYSEILKKEDHKGLLQKLDEVISHKSIVSGENVVIYQFDEEEGTIVKLGNTEGIPSDKNYLNQEIRKGNEMFDSLLEIEEEL